jgi:hypothetical protein
MGNWKEYDLESCRSIEPLAGVYCVFLDDVLHYIGQSDNVRTRIAQHGIAPFGLLSVTRRWRRKRFGRMTIKVRHGGNHKLREKLLIARLMPAENNHFNPTYAKKGCIL